MFLRLRSRLITRARTICSLVPTLKEISDSTRVFTFTFAPIVSIDGHTAFNVLEYRPPTPPVHVNVRFMTAWCRVSGSCKRPTVSNAVISQSPSRSALHRVNEPANAFVGSSRRKPEPHGTRPRSTAVEICFGTYDAVKRPADLTGRLNAIVWARGLSRSEMLRNSDHQTSV